MVRPGMPGVYRPWMPPVVPYAAFQPAPVFAPPPPPPPVVRQTPVMQTPEPVVIPEAMLNQFSNQKSILFSQLVALIRGKGVQQLIIEQPKKHEAVLQGRVILRNGGQTTVTLPPLQGPLLQLLDEYQVRYGYEPQKVSAWQKLKAKAAMVFDDSLVPLLMLGLSIGVSFLAFKRGNAMLAQQRVESMMQKSKKTFADVATKVDGVLGNYTQRVQDVVSQFRRGELDFIIAQGPPGTGKTHLLNAIAREQVDRGNVVALDVGFDAEVRKLLYQVYGGNEQESAQALKSLKKLSNKPIDELLIIVDEMEEFQDDLIPLITKAVGNAKGRVQLPKLRMLATCNDTPVFTDAAKNRIGRGWIFIDHATPDVMADVAAQVLRDLPGVEAAGLKPHLQKLFEQYPGYSTRTLMDAEFGLVPNVAKAVKAGDARDPLVLLEERLKGTHLDDTEIAGLVRRKILERINQGLAPLDANGYEFLNMGSLEVCQTHVKGLDRQIQLNGKAFDRFVDEALDRFNEPLDAQSDQLNTHVIPTFIRTLRQIAPQLLSPRPAVETWAVALQTKFAQHLKSALMEGPASLHMVDSSRFIGMLMNPKKGTAVYRDFMKAGRLYADAVKQGHLRPTDDFKLNEIFEAVVNNQFDGLDEPLRPLAQSLRNLMDRWARQAAP